MHPLMYSTVAEMPSSLCPPIGPVPTSTSTQPKKVGASPTGKEPPLVCWTAMLLICMCACVCVCVCGVCVCVCVCSCACIHASVRQYLTFGNADCVTCTTPNTLHMLYT